MWVQQQAVCPTLPNNPAMPHCIYINVATKEITREEMSDRLNLKLEAYNAMVGDPIDLGLTLPNGDIVYVDGEGEYRKPRAARFAIGKDRFTGNAVVVSYDQLTGDDTNPTSTVAAIQTAVQFLGGGVKESSIGVGTGLESLEGLPAQRPHTMMAPKRARTPEIPGVEACGIDVRQTRAGSKPPTAKRVRTSEVGLPTRKRFHGKGWTPQHHYGKRSDGQSSCSFGRCILPGVAAPMCPCCRAKAPPCERGMHSCKVCRPPSPFIELS